MKALRAPSLYFPSTPAIHTQPYSPTAIPPQQPRLILLTNKLPVLLSAGRKSGWSVLHGPTTVQRDALNSAPIEPLPALYPRPHDEEYLHYGPHGHTTKACTTSQRCSHARQRCGWIHVQVNELAMWVGPYRRQREALRSRECTATAAREACSAPGQARVGPHSCAVHCLTRRPASRRSLPAGTRSWPPSRTL